MNAEIAAVRNPRRSQAVYEGARQHDRARPQPAQASGVDRSVVLFDVIDATRGANGGVRGRQFGDRRDTRTGAQAVARLAGEYVSEYRRRTRFARFLAEAGLLCAPDRSVTVTLDEVRELARAARRDRATVACASAVCMLPPNVLSCGAPPRSRRGASAGNRRSLSPTAPYR